jgi:tripartite ATP-independent transporter DctP family solute receptor
MKKLFNVLLVLSICLVTLVGCSSSAPAETASTEAASKETASKETASKETSTRTIQLGHVNSSKSNDQYQVLAQYFADELKELSNGAFEIDIVSDSILGGERDMLEGMNIGTVDMALITNFSFGTFVPKFMAFDLPYIFNTREEAYSVLDDPEIFDEVAKDLYDSRSVKLLAYGEGGYRNVINNIRPIEKMSDFNGIKIRLPETPLYVSSFKAFGASPTTMAFSETFTAVQQGTVDGLELPISSIYATGYADITKYLTLTEHFYSPAAITMSKSMWESLTEEEQGWFEEAAKNAAKEQRVFVKDIEEQFLSEMEGNGVVINKIDDKTEFIEAAKSVYKEFENEIGAEFLQKVLKKLGR